MADILTFSSDDDDDLTPNYRSSKDRKKNQPAEVVPLTRRLGNDEQAKSDQEADIPDIVPPPNNIAGTVPPPTKKKTDTSSSDSDSAPVVKKKRATRRHTAAAPSTDKSEEITAKTSIYSQRVDNCFSTFLYKNATADEEVSAPVVNLSDAEDTEKIESVPCVPKNVATTPKRTRRGMRTRTSPHDEVDGDIFITDSQTPEKTVPSLLPSCSPSPPPPPGRPLYLQKVRQKRPSKALKTAIANLDRAKSHLVLNSINTSFTSGDDSFSYAPTPDKDEHIIIKVRSRSGVHRFPMKKTDIFATLISKLAAAEKVPEGQCILYLKDMTIEPYQTLTSSGVTIADILQCCIQGEEPFADEELFACDDDDYDDDYIDVRVQSADKKLKVTVSIKKDEGLLKVMSHFAVERKLDLKKIRFEFDGETLKGSETPLGLDMEDGDCIDAIFK